MKTLTWQKPGQQNVAQELIKIIINYVAELRNNNLGLPKTASEDMFFSDGIAIPLSGFKVTGLSQGTKYTFSFYAHINDRGTETEFHVIGKNDGVAYLVNDDNFDRTVEIKGIEPNDEGVVYIEMKPGPNNVQWAKFFGVNTMVLSEE